MKPHEVQIQSCLVARLGAHREQVIVHSEVTGTPAKPRPAATIVLLRRGDSDDRRRPEVLMVRRSPEASFMPGVWVFPGGAIEPGESAADCAARELEEETGIALGAEAELVAWSRWITPEVVPVRFDTHFFVAIADPHSRPVPDRTEVSDAGWFEPGGALEAHRAGDLALVFPTIKTLETLLEHRDRGGSDRSRPRAPGRADPPPRRRDPRRPPGPAALRRWLRGSRRRSREPAGMTRSLPVDVRACFERFVTTEFTTVDARQQPITWPVTPYYRDGGPTIDVTTGLGYPKKADDARRHPRVALLFSDPTGSGLERPAQVLVQGIAAVDEDDLAANRERYMRESVAKLPATRKMHPPKPMRKPLDWYYARIYIGVRPERVFVWPGGDAARRA